MTDQTADTTAPSGTIALDDFRKAFILVWEETFDTVTGIFLDQGTSMFETLATISAEEASRPVGGGCASIAAQVNHVWYYLDLLARNAGADEAVQGDWDGSWAVGPVNDDAWQEMIAQLREAVGGTRGFVETFEGWNAFFLAGAFGIIAHCAYHLGEIRAGLCTIKGHRDKGA